MYIQIGVFVLIKQRTLIQGYIDVIYKKTDMQVGIILFFLKI